MNYTPIIIETVTLDPDTLVFKLHVSGPVEQIAVGDILVAPLATQLFVRAPIITVEDLFETWYELEVTLVRNHHNALDLSKCVGVGIELKLLGINVREA